MYKLKARQTIRIKISQMTEKSDLDTLVATARRTLFDVVIVIIVDCNLLTIPNNTPAIHSLPGISVNIQKLEFVKISRSSPCS